MEDLYFQVSTTIWDTKLIGFFHEFDAEEGGNDLGHEYDFRIVRKFGDHFEGEIKHANYNSEGFAVDIEKLWVFVTFRY